MSRIFLSHSSANNAEAMAVCHWLAEEGWTDIFLDLDPERGIKAGEHWEEALRKAADRCEAVVILVSRAWLDSEWCRDEFRLARHLRKRLFGVLIEDIAPHDLPAMMTREWQLVNITPAGATRTFPITLPRTTETVEVTFGIEGLHRLKLGLVAAGLDPRFFAWPPESDPQRPPYRGLLPLEAEDAGIFFGRDAPIIEAFDRLRGLRDAAPPRLFVILGASGAGKSSFLRAGLLPRLARDDRNFLPLPVVRPGRAAIHGETGLVRALEAALQARGLPHVRADIRAAVVGGASTLRPLLASLVADARQAALSEGTEAQSPILVLPIDQGEELFLAEGREESEQLLALLRDLISADTPALLVLVAMRSDTYERLQTAPALDGIHQVTLSLPPMPRGAYQSVIEGPAERLGDGPRALKIDPALTQALLADVESGGGRDALPLIAFTLERLYLEFRGRHRLTLADYESLGRIGGSIEAAIQRAIVAADTNPAIPRDRAARLLLLRRGLVPWLAGIDPETGLPRRRVARLSEIPAEARPLIDLLKEQRLLSTDVSPETGEVIIEPAHETLLRQWGMLQGWLAEDAGLLGILEGVKRASRDWAANAKDPAWLTHTTGRLDAAERLRERPDLAANLEPTDWAYLAACRACEREILARRRRVWATVGALCLATVAGLGYAGWANRSYLGARKDVLFEKVWPRMLTAEQERALKTKDPFTECAHCPEMVVIPAGKFMMGSPAGAPGTYDNERPQHEVVFARPFAVSRFELTFDEWQVCVVLGGCTQRPDDQGWGGGTRPVVRVNWYGAQEYVAWLSKRTGKTYRLLSESEWEYAARAGTTTAYSWGDDPGKGNADCDGCGSQWDNNRTAPVGSFAPNPFGLYDMHGNVLEWVEDCYRDSYAGAPTDGSAVTAADCQNRVLRGGSWYNHPENIRSATRNWARADMLSTDRSPDKPDAKFDTIGVRVARSLMPPAP